MGEAQEVSMIVTTGKIIKVDLGLTYQYNFERTSEAPGICSVSHKGVTMTLPANIDDMERFIAAYRRAVSEDVGYREMKCE